MREILFRGKKTGSKRWAEGSLIIAGDYCCILENEDDVHPMDYPYLNGDMGTIDGKATPVVPETVGQYTGLTDKNDKKIFEGDILKCDPRPKCTVFYKVVYQQEYSRFSFVQWSTHKYQLYEWAEFEKEKYCCEVIGNIYDNPDLLESLESD